MYREVIHVKHQLNEEWVVKKEIVYTAVGLKVKWFVLCSVVLGFYVLRGVIVHRLLLMYNLSVFSWYLITVIESTVKPLANVRSSCIMSVSVYPIIMFQCPCHVAYGKSSSHRVFSLEFRVSLLLQIAIYTF